MYDFAISADQTQLMLKTIAAAYIMTQNANQLLYSQLFSNNVWARTNATLTAGQTDSAAGTEAFTLTAIGANATILQSVVLTAGSQSRTFSIGLKRKTGTGDISITVDGSTYVVKTITGAWARFETTLAASGSVTAGVKIATNGDEVYIEWAQLQDGASSAYAGNTTSRLTVTAITDGDYPLATVRGVVNMDGRFFVMTSACDIYQSALDNGLSWSATEFIGSQLTPEVGVFLHRHQNYILAMKEWSCEFFYDAANATGSILSPVANAAFNVGVASSGSVAEVAGNLYWMGQTKSGFGRAIFRLNGTVPEKVSTPQVEKILNADNLATVYSWFANTGSHVLYGITLVTSSVTLVFDVSTGQWSFFTELTASGSDKTVTAVSTLGVVSSTAHGFSDGDVVLIAGTNSSWNGWQIATAVSTNAFTIQLPSGVTAGTAFTADPGGAPPVPNGTAHKYTESYFPVVASTSVNGVQYMQHATSGALYSFSQSAYIDPVGAIAARIRTPKFDASDAKFKFMSKAEVIGDKIASSMTVRYTDDDFMTYSSARAIDLNVQRSQLRRMGNFTRRSFELLHVKNALLRLEALEIEGGV